MCVRKGSLRAYDGKHTCVALQNCVIDLRSSSKELVIWVRLLGLVVPREAPLSEWHGSDLAIREKADERGFGQHGSKHLAFHVGRAVVQVGSTGIANDQESSKAVARGRVGLPLFSLLFAHHP